MIAELDIYRAANILVKEYGAEQAPLMAATIDIGGQSVHASAVVCRQPNGTWRLNPTENARLVPTPAAQ